MLNRSKSETPCAAIRALQRLPLIGRFVSEERGIAAVEFALVAPVMVAAYLGSVDLTQGVMVDRKVSVMTSAIGDLVAQSEEISTSEINNIFNIANALMAPYDKSTIKLRVSSLQITNKKQGSKREAKVIWSDGKNQSAYAKDTEILVPESIATNATSVIFTEGSYTFTPLFGQILTEKLVLEDSYYHVPRISDSVARK